MGRQLVPARSSSYIKDPYVATLEEIERLLNVVPKIKLGAAWDAKRFKPGREHKIGHKCAIDLISKLVSFARVTDLISVEGAALGIRLYKYREIYLGIS